MKEYKNLIHPNTLRFYSLPTNAKPYVKTPVDLLNSNRLDVMARIIYARSYLSGTDMTWGRHCYENLMKSWTNDFAKGGEVEPGRSSMSDYHQQFTELLNNIQRNNFNSDVSLVPTCKNTIVDGAHRLAASLVLNQKKISCIELDGEQQFQNYQILKNIGMDIDVLDNMLYEFIKLKPNTRLAVIFPKAKKIRKKAESILSSQYQIDATLNKYVSPNGYKNLVGLFYGGHEWWSEANAKNFARLRYKSFTTTQFIFFQSSNNDDLRIQKEKIRDLIDLGNNSIHTTDTHEETIRVAELILNKNGFEWLNNSQAPYKVQPVYDGLIDDLENLNLDSKQKNSFCLDSGFVMASYGLRDTRDMDIITNDPSLCENHPILEFHNNEYDVTDFKPEQIVCDPRLHYYKDGFKYVALSVIKLMKLKRNTLKDKRDVLKIEKIQKLQNFSFSYQFHLLLIRLSWYLHYVVMKVNLIFSPLLKRLLPKKYHSNLKAFRKKIFNI